MKPFKFSAFWQALSVIVIAYLVFDNAFPPVMPLTLLIQYMLITILGVLLYFAFDEQRWLEFKQPLKAVLSEKRLILVRWGLLILIPLIVAYAAYQIVKPTNNAPVELRQVHPAPPSKLKVFEKSYDLTKLENPVRVAVIKNIQAQPEVAQALYDKAVDGGREVYFKNCFYCHGDLLDGQGPIAQGLNPLPANFQDVGTIAQLQESFLFWRITTGGPGLPKEGTPWNSAMPVWHEIISEEDVWNVITYLYDTVGQVPRIWDPEISKVVSKMNNNTLDARAQFDGLELYQFRCAACHGEEGLGDGTAADYLYPKPRDFSLALFKYKSTPGSIPASDDDLYQTIAHGLAGTGMPGWSSLLNDKQIKSLIPVIKRFDMTSAWVPESAEDSEEEVFDDDGHYLKDDFVQFTELEPLTGQIAYSVESVKLGKAVFLDVCAECHGDKGRGNISSGNKLEDDWGDRIWPRDLTKPETWRASFDLQTNQANQAKDIAKIYQRLSIGIPGTPMPSHRAVEAGNEDPIALDDRWHVANFVYSLRETNIAVSKKAVITAFKLAEELPDNFDDQRWQLAEPIALHLVPNVIKDDRLFTPLNDSITVRALYNEQSISFLVEINDRTDSRPGESVSEQIQDENLTLQPDAIAIQFPKVDAFVTTPVVEKPLYRHGDKSHPTTIWYWNAGSIEPAVAASSKLFDATGSNSPLKLRSGDQLNASGQWKNGRWQVIMTRPRFDPNSADVSFSEGQFIPISFANWDGSNGEIGSKHTFTSWYWLVLPSPIDVSKTYGIPFGLALFVFILGLLLVRRYRQNPE